MRAQGQIAAWGAGVGVETAIEHAAAQGGQFWSVILYSSTFSFGRIR